jgi:hypothetical protein
MIAALPLQCPPSPCYVLRVRGVGTATPARGGGRPRAASGWVLALVLLVPARGLAATEPVKPAPTAADASPRVAEPAAVPTEVAPSPAASLDPDAARRRQWASCAHHVEPCTRSRAARALLLTLGLAGGTVAAGLLFGLGDRLVQADPATLLVGMSALAGMGAVVGAIAGRLGADGPGLPDRLRPATVSLAQSYAGPRILDETPAHGTLLRVAPTMFLPGSDGRLRLFGHVGGWLVPVREVDPRPQHTEVLPGQQSTAPRVLRQRRLSVGLGLDLAVALPYPLLAPHRSARLGATELRWRPEVQIRRDTFAPGTSQAAILERTMLLPLTVGVRWHLSERQRLTLYAGPRFDVVAFSDRGSTDLRRGGAQIGPLYGEAWYDLDVPLDPRTRRNDRPRSLVATGQLTLGYIHAKFDGHGFDLGPVIGFLGPVHVGWATRLRPVGSPLAAQLGAFARLGNGDAMVALELGLVVPDPHLRGRGAR